jgi:hypothetical protein
MKDKKRLSIILGAVGVGLIIYGCIMAFVSNLKADQKEMNSRMDVILKEYDKFEKNIEEFNATRKSLHEEFLDKVYYETLAQNDTSYKTKLTDYETQVATISKSTKTIRQYCKDGIYYSSSDVNTKCSSFKLGYEEMVNSFVDDINTYNKNITAYNKYLDDEKDTTSLKLETYQTKKTYIDYNNDGEYSGKEDSDSNE